MITILLATLAAAYGVWYGLFAKEISGSASLDWENQVSIPTQAIPPRYVVTVSHAILIAGVAEILKMWKSH